jgi:hypothetical protein
VASNSNLRHLFGDAPEFFGYLRQKREVSGAIPSKGKSVTEINLSCIQSPKNDPPQKFGRGHVRQFRRKLQHETLVDSEPFHPLHFLLKGLQKWWRRLRMKDGTRMRIECYRGRGQRGRARPFDDTLHDRLMTAM